MEIHKPAIDGMRRRRFDHQLSLDDSAIFRRRASRNAASDPLSGPVHLQPRARPLLDSPYQNAVIEHSEEGPVRCTICKHLNIDAETCLHPRPLPSGDGYFALRVHGQRIAKLHSSKEPVSRGLVNPKTRTGQPVYLNQPSIHSTGIQHDPTTISSQEFPWHGVSRPHDYRDRNSYNSSQQSSLGLRTFSQNTSASEDFYTAKFPRKRHRGKQPALRANYELDSGTPPNNRGILVFYTTCFSAIG